MGIRDGRVSADLLNSVRAEAYGDRRPLNQLGAISTHDNEILIRLYDCGLVNQVVQAIHDSGLGLTAVAAKTSVAVKVPRLSYERRLELISYCKKLAEGQRVAVRNIRRNMRKDGKLSDNKIEEIIKGGLAEIDEMLARKIERLSGI